MNTAMDTNLPSVEAALPPLIELTGLRKRYENGILASDGVSLCVQAGQIHAIVGENGAGKSTVMKMLYGLEMPDAGEIRLDGVVQNFKSPQQAIAAGIGLVPQHLQLLPSLTVAENVVLGAEPMQGIFFDFKSACRRTEQLARQHGLPIDPRARVADLSAGAQQRVEILKALHRSARVLLMDEPTALLSPQESDALFTSLRKFVDEGLSIVLITHKLGEVLHLSQTFTALRAGRVTGGGYSSDITESALTELIVGRALEVTRVPRVIAKGRTPLLRAHGLTYLPAHGRAELLDVSLEVAPGEILGIAGVEGNGQNRLSELLSGLIAPTCGVASVAGRNYAGMGTRHAQHLGVGCVSEDRLHSGVAPSLSIAENTASLDYSRRPVSRFGMLNIGFIRRRARELIKSFRVRAANETMAIGALSGGNMQKIVIGRELRAQPKVLIASQPTRGVDIGAAVELRAALTALRDAGTAILLISADLDEVLALSDRIAVLYEGRIVAHFAAEQASPTELGLYMTGLATDEGANGTLGRPFTLLDRKAVSS